jgi:hypothetical protein
MRAAALIAFAAAVLGASAPARADDTAGGVATFAAIVGVNRSVDRAVAMLRYADDDAIRYDELSAARARGQRTAFYFIYAGHGSTNGSDAYLALEDARLGLADVERDIVDRAGADETHLIVDACHSYFLAYGRGPGGTRREIHGFAPTEGLARRADVGLLLSTTSARESHEWEGFQAGVFSHEVRSGLFGAADYDGDGRISYGEMAAFVNRANAAIPNERFRPDVFARPPARSAPLVDLRGGTGRHLRVDGVTEAGRYSLEDGRGVRLADFFSARGHGVSLLLPAGAGRLYLRRPSDGREYEIPPAPDLIQLAALEAREPRSTARGAAHDAFSLIFSLPFDDTAFAPSAAVVTVAGADLTAAGDGAEPDGRRPRWRTIGGVASLGVATLSLAAATTLTVSAHTAAGQARSAPSQREAAALDERVTARNAWARVCYGLGAAAAIAGGLALVWPSSGLYATGGAERESAMLEVGGRF